MGVVAKDQSMMSRNATLKESVLVKKVTVERNVNNVQMVISLMDKVFFLNAKVQINKFSFY